MKVFVIGSNGQIGKYLIQLLKESNEHTVRAMVRRKEQAEALIAEHVEAVIADLEGSVEPISEAARGCDAIVFTAGSGGQTGFDKTLLIDLDGTAKAIEAAELAGIERFVMISAIQAHNRENWHESIRPYYAAKHYADKILELSPLTYTIIRPGSLLNEPGTGRIAASENISQGSIAREDVAHTIVAALSAKQTYRKSFDLISGDETIASALQKL